MARKEEFFNWLVYNKHLKESSLTTVERRFRYFFVWLGKHDLSAKNAESFILEMCRKGRRNQTLNGYILLFIYLGQFLKIHLTENISFFPKQQRVPTILSIDEIQAIIDVPMVRGLQHGVNPERTRERNLTAKLTIFFLASTGCRIDEMASLTKENLYLGIDSNYAVFKDTKTGVDRKVPIPLKLADELAEYSKNKKPRDLVFTSLRGHKIVEQTFNPMLREKAEAAEINKHVHAHCFRNSYIMEHIRQGTDVLTIAKLVGHADVNTTMGYTKFTYDDIQKGAENHPLFSKELPTSKILDKIEEAVRKWPVDVDTRFAFEVARTSKSLLVKLFARD